MVRYIGLTFATLTMVLLTAVPAFAFQETSTTANPAATPAYSCPSCHGLEEGETSPTVGPRSPYGTRKGPHGGYTAGTAKCETCHAVHGAASGRALLPQATIAATCNTCHDGTGGSGVYGVIKQRTGQTDVSGHRIGVSSGGKVVVPGGDPSGGSLEREFSGEGGSLTCTDCHSPHDSNTVAAFVGDRKRSTADSTSDIATNRLLLQKPTSADTTVTAYGTEWCASCHKGSNAGTMNHPVADMSSSPSADYMHVTRLSDYDTRTVDPNPGPLGGSNLGYIVPSGSGSKPICQQCHEDSRTIGTTPGIVDSATESFLPSVDGASAGNPTFQNFPHETVNPKMLIETDDGLCMNCHVTTPAGTVH